MVSLAASLTGSQTTSSTDNCFSCFRRLLRCAIYLLWHCLHSDLRPVRVLTSGLKSAAGLMTPQTVQRCSLTGHLIRTSFPFASRFCRVWHDLQSGRSPSGEWRPRLKLAAGFCSRHLEHVFCAGIWTSRRLSLRRSAAWHDRHADQRPRLSLGSTAKKRARSSVLHLLHTAGSFPGAYSLSRSVRGGRCSARSS